MLHHSTLLDLRSLPLIALYLACADEGLELFWHWPSRTVRLREARS